MGLKSLNISSLAVSATEVTDSGTSVTITDHGAVVLYLSNAGARTVTPNASPVSGDSLRVIDTAGTAGTNIITVTGLGTIQTDNGAMEWYYNGSSWDQTDAVREILVRNASTNEISAAEPDTLLANAVTSGNAGALSDPSVADTDFTSIGANVDQTVADEFGNSIIYTDRVAGAALLTTVNNGFFTLIPTLTTLSDGDTDTEVARTNQGGGGFIFDLGSAQDIANLRVAIRNTTDKATTINAFVGALDDGADFATNIISESIDMTGTFTIHSFDYTQINKRYLRVVFGSDFRISELTINNVSDASTLNTFDTNLASATSGTFSASTFKAYDETDTLISGTGKVNVAYEVDGGGMGSLVDQDTFKALDDIAYTTQFDIRLQLVGDQRFSKATIATPNTVLQLTSDGQAQVMDGGVKVSSFGKLGMAPVSLTTTERDALAGMDDGAIIFNETTSKLNFYNGSSWEAITSS